MPQSAFTVELKGLELRDFFALAVAHGIPFSRTDDDFDLYAAKRCYHIADAFLKAREKDSIREEEGSEQ